MTTAEEIKQELSIERLLSFYGIVTPRGMKVMIKCCFHDDKTPSLSINKAKNRFHCYGGSCGAKGSVIDFVMRMEGLDFKEACRFIEEKLLCNKQLKIENGKLKIKRDPKLETRSEGAIKAKREYENAKMSSCEEEGTTEENREVYRYLYQITELTARGKQYLREERCFADETIEKFGMHSIDTPNMIFAQLVKKFNMERLRQAGLLTTKGRFIFWAPGILIPFFYNDDIEYYQYRFCDEKKYLFLSGLPKQKFLGNIQKGDCFVFEGVFDAMAFYELTGKDNFIAVGGTTEFDRGRIEEYIEQKTGEKEIRLISCLDDDDAGKGAMDRESEENEVWYYSPKAASRKLGISEEKITDWNEVLKAVKQKEEEKEGKK